MIVNGLQFTCNKMIISKLVNGVLGITSSDVFSDRYRFEFAGVGFYY